MTVDFQQSIICKLGGYVNSKPELVISYPPIEDNIENPQETIKECLPFGCKTGDIIEKKYLKNTLISYIFNVEKGDERDDLFSFSILLNKKKDAKLYKPIIKDFIELMKQNGLLKEDTFVKNQELIYRGLNEEKDLKIEGKSIPLSDLFEEKREELNLSELDPKGSFF
jgi:hypothetical protein